MTGTQVRVSDDATKALRQMRDFHRCAITTLIDAGIKVLSELPELDRQQVIGRLPHKPRRKPGPKKR